MREEYDFENGTSTEVNSDVKQFHMQFTHVPRQFELSIEIKNKKWEKLFYFFFILFFYIG